jgi:hypothetical protein
MPEFPRSLPQFQKFFPDDAACVKYLEAMKWPDGFVCPTCQHQGEPFRLSRRSVGVAVVLRCRSCRRNTSLTAGTVMHSSHTRLSTWFWGAYLITTQTPGISSVQFQRQLGLTRNQTAFTMLHKIRSAMVRLDRDKIGSEHPVELDECYVGGATRGEGCGVHHMSTVIGAVEVRTKKLPDDPEIKIVKRQYKKGKATTNKKTTYAGRLRLQVIPDRCGDTLTEFVKENVASPTTIYSDGWQGYNKFPELGYKHKPLVLDGDPEKAEAHLPVIHRAFSNLKTWLLGTHHGRVEPQHLQAYLNEFVFRFNRRFHPMAGFNSILGLAARRLSPTYEELYSGTWEHPGSCPNIEFL